MHIFQFPWKKNSRQFVRFRWSRNLYEFLCLYFGLGPALRIFTKLLKVPMTILRRINIKILIYLDGIRDSHESRHSNLPCATSRIFQKLEKVSVDSSAGKRVLWPGNQFCHSRTFFNQNKNSESRFRMSEFVK